MIYQIITTSKKSKRRIVHERKTYQEFCAKLYELMTNNLNERIEVNIYYN